MFYVQDKHKSLLDWENIDPRPCYQHVFPSGILRAAEYLHFFVISHHLKIKNPLFGVAKKRGKFTRPNLDKNIVQALSLNCILYFSGLCLDETFANCAKTLGTLLLFSIWERKLGCHPMGRRASQNVDSRQ